MQVRKVVLATGEIYHIYNRSNGTEQIFDTPTQLRHILEALKFYRYPQTLRLSEFKKLSEKAKQIYLHKMNQEYPLVDIYAFSIMPNHYHLLLKQLQENGIKEFITNSQISYAKYFNKRFNRHGSLFQRPFQGKWIETDEQFLHVSRYIHLNHVTAFIVNIEELLTYPYSSLPEYLGYTNNPWLRTLPILNMFASNEGYKEFIKDNMDYQRTLAGIQHLIID